MSTQQPAWLVFSPGIFLLMWSTGYVAAKFGLGYIEPITFLTLRFACVVVIMAMLFVTIRPPLPKSRAEWMHLAVVSFILQFGVSQHPVTSNLLGYTVGFSESRRSWCCSSR